MPLNHADYSRIKALVADESSVSREALANTLRELGLSKVDMANSYSEALTALSRRPPDLILCDYHLGKPGAGQAFLQEARRRDLLSPHCSFIMVTSEREQKKIMAAAEWEPDGYLLKPFTPQTLISRVELCVAKKLPLQRASEHIQSEDYGQAIEELRQHISPSSDRATQPGAMRLLIETLLRMGQPGQALTLAQDVVRKTDMPWAKLLQARAMARKGSLPEAISRLEELVAANPQYMMARDELQKSYQLAGDFVKAQEALEAALAISPHNAARKAELGQAAFRAGDYEKAIAHLQEGLSRPDPRGAPQTESWGLLANALLEKGEARKAREVALKMKAESRASLEAQQISSALLIRAGQALDEPATELKTLLAPLKEAFAKRELSRSARPHVIAAAYACQDLDFAEAALASSLRAQSGSAMDFTHLKTILKKLGYADRFKALQDQVALMRAQEISKTRELQQAGLWQEAALYLIDLSSDPDAGIPLLHQTAQAIFEARQRDLGGEGSKEFVARLLARARQIDPLHPLVGPLDTLHKSIDK